MPRMNDARRELAEKIAEMGELANTTQAMAKDADYSFIVGLIRAAGEALSVAYNAVNDPAIPDEDLR